MNKILLLILGILCSQIGLAQSTYTQKANQMRIQTQGTSQVFELANEELEFLDPNQALLRRNPSKEALKANQKQLVVYPLGQIHQASNRYVVNPKIVIKTDSPEALDQILSRFEVELKALRTPIEHTYLLYTATSLDAWQLTPQLRNIPGIKSANPVLARQASLKVLPIDPPNDPFFTEQWYLSNSGQSMGVPGIDVGLGFLWGETYGAGLLGRGVRVAILDAGIDNDHPDLAENVDTTSDFDYNFNDDDPDPVANEFGIGHGTSCAGLVAAVGNNNEGVVGVAPGAELVGVRIVAAPSDDELESQALGHLFDADNDIDIYSNSWGPSDNGFTKEGPGPLTQAVFKAATERGRNGLGSIYVWSAGNGKGNGDNSNYDGYTNSIYTIAVGALGNNGRSAIYSESGANVMLVAPSNFNFSINFPLITTTTHGDIQPGQFYTTGFNGTSASCPLVAGVVALMLEANPNLGWRDVQEILMTSARIVQVSDADWIINGAGFLFNHKFGAGLVNAEDAVRLALDWNNLGPQLAIEQAASLQDTIIPDNNSQGVSYAFDLTNEQNLRVEHVELGVQINHSQRGNLKITLTSPSGTESNLAEVHGDTTSNYNWTFSTVRNWGESSQGTWTVNIADEVSGEVGSVEGLTLKVRGSIPDTIAPQIIALSPQDDAVNVPIDTDLSIRFSETIQIHGDSLRIHQASNDEVVQSIDLRDRLVQLNSDSTQLAITLQADLAEDTEFYISLPAGSLSDLRGNIFLGLDDKTTWNFMTEAPTSLGETLRNPIQIFPNPSYEKVVISPQASLAGLVQYRLIDAQGKLLQIGNLNIQEVDVVLTLPKLADGLYFLELEVEGKKWIQRLIKH